MTLAVVARFDVPTTLIDYTDRELKAAGDDRFEAFVLWTGSIQDDHFIVSNAQVPRQTSLAAAAGHCVRVEAAELHRLNVWLFERSEILAVQVHTHPGNAYHSDTDDSFPIVTERGGLSIVVPNFAAQGLRGPGVALYRLDDSGWQSVSRSVLQEIS